MEIKKCEDIKEFIEKIDEMTKASSAEWQGKTVTNEAPLSAENIEAFLNINASFLRHYSHNPTLGQSLEEFSKRFTKELGDEKTLPINKYFLSNIKTMRLPRELHSRLIKDVAKDFVQKEPTYKTSDNLSEDKAEHKKKFDEFLKDTSLVNKEFKAMTNDAKVIWINSHPMDLQKLTGIKTSDQLMTLLKDHGKGVTNLCLVNFNDLSEDQVGQIALYCPNLEKLDLPDTPTISDKVFDHLEKMDNLIDLTICGSNFTVLSFDKLPKKLEVFGGLYLLNLKQFNGTLPASLKTFDVPDFPLIPKEQVERLLYNLPPRLQVLTICSEALTEVDLDRLPEKVRSLTFCGPFRITNFLLSKIPDKLEYINVSAGPFETYQKLRQDLATNRYISIVWSGGAPRNIVVDEQDAL